MAGGGTAGHTSPLLATADALRRIDATVEVTALGTPRGLEVRVVPEAGYPLELVPPVPHEGNALPGLANKLGAGFPRHVATSFPSSRIRHGRYLGLPIRRMISTLD